MRIRIHSFDIERHDIATRMPFKYGIATMTDLPHVFIRIKASFDASSQIGISGDHLPPKWFTKNPDTDPIEEIDEMLTVIQQAGSLAQTIESDCAFDFWYALYLKQSEWAKAKGVPPLLAHFGTSLIERALIDAFCRRKNAPFAELLQQNAFGIHWEEIRPELSGYTPSDLLPQLPLGQARIRHTVGLADYLREEDIPKNQRINDGLPESLESCTAFYGVSHFKIKINGQPEADQDRLQSIARLFECIGLVDYRFTLDGNEQFSSVESFRTAWERWIEDPKIAPFFRRILFVEQPFHRSLALGDPIGEGLLDWKNAPSIIIDESDGDLESLPRALEIGYRGTSHKNCKGVFKGITNRATINLRNQQLKANPYIMSGEDLANIGPIANHQDLVVQACLGNESVERNGHHYFRGLDVFDSCIQEQNRNSFPKLYTKDNGIVRLNIRNGELPLGELTDELFGVPILPEAPIS